jgi:hypothetical protein
LPIKLDAASIGCSYCGVEHPVSDADRQRMQSAAAELRKTDALSNAAEEIRARLLKPTLAALFSGVWESFMLILWILLGWALGGAAGELIHRPPIFERGNAYIPSTLIVYLPVIALCFGVFALWKSRSLRALRTAVAALPPLGGHGAVRCRSCGSDLREGTDERAFVVCNYCGTQNLIGLAEVRRREQLGRARGAQRLEELRTTETKLGNRVIVLVASLVVMPILLGAALNPVQNRIMVAVFPLLPAPAKPGPWAELPAKLALLVPKNAKKPWPIVWVVDRQRAPKVTVRHRGKEQVVEAGQLRQLPLRMGLRIVDPSKRGRGEGIIADTEQLLFPGGGAYDDGGFVLSRSEPKWWIDLAVVPEWGSAKAYDAYFDWKPPKPQPSEAMNVVVPDPAELRQGFVVWAAGVELSSSTDPAVREGEDQVLGIPDVYPTYGTSPKAWVPAPDEKKEAWLVVRFDEPVFSQGVAVVETHLPGAVIRIDDFSNRAWPDPLWIGEVETATKCRVLTLPLAERRTISALRVTVDASRVAGRPEIDGIGLVRPQGGPVPATGG